MNITYCNTKCSIGMAACNELLNRNNSAYDAIIDFKLFAEDCFKTCKHKNEFMQANNVTAIKNNA